MREDLRQNPTSKSVLSLGEVQAELTRERVEIERFVILS
jgi:hypothetical protein